METNSHHSSAALSPTELEQLRLALADHYRNAKGILGSQLGAFIRPHLTNPDLKVRFGGLKSFVAHYFPAEIVWSGRKGLDDLYDISFATEGSGGGGMAWQRVPPEPSAGLWSAVTNPSIYVQFAWSASDQSLFQASADVPPTEGLVAVEKLTKTDYQNIATEFIGSIDAIDASRRTQALESSGSNVEFTRLMREQGILAKWEEFRITHALRVFTERLRAVGAESPAISHWEEVLRASQQEARARRLKKAALVSAVQQSRVNRDYARDEIPDSRAVAIKAMDFLSDSELSDLRLPLGSVMRALGSLLKRP